MKRKLRPMLDGPWWLAGPNPDLSHVFRDDSRHRADAEAGDYEANAAVDHHLFRGPDGVFHMWACVRATVAGRVFYRWQSREMTASPWDATGEVMRRSEGAGECINDVGGQEWLQSPYFVTHGGVIHMFYGGHRAGVDADGAPVDDAPPRSLAKDHDRSLYQVCLMTSRDGYAWTRHDDGGGNSRLFLGPGETRDPCVLRVDGKWLMYYAGYYDREKPDEGAGFVVRTSDDLVNWSDWRLVHRDARFGKGRCDCECPFVAYRDGYFYLFRTEDYYTCRTHVFRSEDPFDFGLGDAMPTYIGVLPCAAPEIYAFDGQEYISSSHNPRRGEYLCRLRWVDDVGGA